MRVDTTTVDVSSGQRFWVREGVRMGREASLALVFRDDLGRLLHRETQLIKYGQLPWIVDRLAAGCTVGEALDASGLTEDERESAFLSLGRLVAIGMLAPRTEATKELNG